MNEFLVAGLRKLVAKTADDFDPSALSAVAATRAVEEWGHIERIACAAKLRAAGRAEDTGIDAEAVVAQASGISQSAARKQTRVRRKAKGKTKEQFERGQLSPVQAEAIADAVEANPDAENSLLGLAASTSTSELLDACAKVRHDALNADGSLAARQREARFLRTWKDSLGMTRLSGALEPLLGAKLTAELSRRADRMFRQQSRAKGTVDTPEQRAADALGEIVASCSDGGGRRQGPRTVVRLIVHKSAAERGYAEPGEKCETAEGEPLPMAAVDEALLDPDTKVQEVVIDEIDVRTIKTFKKYIPKRVRDALEAKGVCCSVPGCRRTQSLQIDHTAERRDGGPTTLLNLGWLCPTHHRLKTCGLYRLWRDEEGWHWEPTHRARAPAS